MQKSQDEYFMRLALTEARHALEEGNIPIGALITHADEPISVGRNRTISLKTDLAHAELDAIQPIQEFLFTHKNECDIYTTLEPCIMCFGAIIHFKFRRLIISSLDHAVGALRIIENSPYYLERKPITTIDVLSEESMDLLKSYIYSTGRSLHLLNNSF